ncbi:hypothetical protein W824_08670 [Clavibacter cf. michiganensis LMG 26808]|uniref:Uncharacterized protein n=1 Tax=Clavibacter michiganensis TaxID=28447 RepID=A0A399P0V6_9MICO|nr:hypothetical protein W824_08670 [Clavibacter cf. michiganensis LMG 26808]RII98456.1 hypothetical protein DZF96_02945 [Clavibacter michiganensis]
MFALLQIGVFAAAQASGQMLSVVLFHVFAFVNFGSAWAVVGIAAGGIMLRLRGSIVAGALSLLAAVWCYYGTAWLSTPGSRWLLDSVAYWSLAAVAGGPFLGAVGALGRRRDGWSLIAWVGGPLLIVMETGQQVLVGDEPGYVLLHIVAWILTAAGVGIGVRRLRATPRIAPV